MAALVQRTSRLAAAVTIPSQSNCIGLYEHLSLTRNQTRMKNSKRKIKTNMNEMNWKHSKLHHCCLHLGGGFLLFCLHICSCKGLNVFVHGAVYLNVVQMGACWNCQSVVPLNLPKCLTCDVLLTTDRSVLQPKQREDPACLVCVICGTANSRNDRNRSCMTCNASLSNAKVVVLIFTDHGLQVD